MPDSLPARVTTPLLILITQQSLDEDYQHVADQRARSGNRRPTGRRSSTLVALAGFAVLVTVAALQTSRDAGVRSEDRDQLITRIDARRAGIERLQRDLALLREANVAADTTYQSLGQQLTALTARAAELGAGTGFAILAGPGVRVTVDDGEGQDAQVRDSDLRLLVNGLWEAGASGISVNGQRITSLSALRNSGQAIRVDGVSLSPPYTVDAVGDTRTMQARFAESTSGSRFRDLTSQLGMPFTMHNVGDLMLRAADDLPALRYVRSGSAAGAKPPVNQEDQQ